MTIYILLQLAYEDATILTVEETQEDLEFLLRDSIAPRTLAALGPYAHTPLYQIIEVESGVYDPTATRPDAWYDEHGHRKFDPVPGLPTLPRNPPFAAVKAEKRAAPKGKKGKSRGRSRR
jgi:hypothetical protein